MKLSIREKKVLYAFACPNHHNTVTRLKWLTALTVDPQAKHRTLELGQVQESDFFSHTIHDDLDSIVQDIRQAHVTDRTTADPQPTFTEVKEKFDRAMQLGSNEERVIHEFCDQMQIPFDKIASEDFSAFMRILSLSKLLKNPNNMRGKARPPAYRGTKKRKKR